MSSDCSTVSDAFRRRCSCHNLHKTSQSEKTFFQLEQTADVELLGTYFTVLVQLCKDNKAARRFCRLRILPPLHAADVARPPNEGTTTRNRLVRLMSRSMGNCKTLIAEFLFVLCKRSVPRLVKYCGFGHAAGHLADYGYLK